MEDEIDKQFSFLYSQIVEHQNDMIGHIAYSLYKTSKIEFIKNFKSEHNGQIPSEAELKTFHIVSSTNIPGFRIQAELILSNFLQISLNESIAEIQLDTLKNQENILLEIIKPIKPKPDKGQWAGFWMSVLVKGTQTLVVGIIFFIIIFGASAKEDFWGTVRKWIPQPNKVENIKHKDSLQD